MYQSKVYTRSELPAEKWDVFVSANANNIVYFLSWYLDSVCHWSAIVVEKNSEWVAVMPIQMKQKYLITYSLQPFFCKYLGTLIRNDITAHNNVKAILNTIISAIPSSVWYLNYHFHPGFDHFMPFKRQGYTVLAHYSYKLDLSADRSATYSTSITNHIRRSIKNELSCNVVDTPDAILRIAVSRQLLDVNAQAAFKKLWASLRDHNSGLMLTITDTYGNTHCAAAFAICEDHAYMILSVVDDTYKKQGGNALLINEAMKMLNARGIQWFYFEGSMLENVEAYINGFRPQKVLYFNIYKSRLPLLNEVILPLKNKVSALL